MYQEVCFNRGTEAGGGGVNVGPRSAPLSHFMLATGLCCQETAPWHQPKREDYYPSHFSESAKLTNDPMCVTESHWLKNQQCIVYRFQSGLCPCAAFTWTWRWTCGATSTAGENLTYKVKSRPFKFHDSITSRSVSQMSANLSGVEFKIIVSKFWKR